MNPTLGWGPKRCSFAPAAAVALATLAAIAPARAHASAAPSHTGTEVSCRDFRTGSVVSVFAERITAAGAVHDGWAPDSSRLCVGTGHRYSFAAAPDGAGGALIAWVEGGASGSDIRAVRLAADGSIASGWPAGGIALCSSPNDQYAPRAVADGAGGALVTWQDFRNGRGQVFIERVSANGVLATGWPVGGIAVCAAPSNQSGAVIASDGAGGALVAWQDYRDGQARVRAGRISAAGALASGWPADGVVLAASDHAQQSPALLADGAGGALVAWEEATGDGAERAHATRIGADGALAQGWPATGLALATGSGSQRLPALASDGAGGAIVAWYDTRGGLGDIYAQHVTAGGALASGWPAEGLAACAAGGEQYGPAILADGSGGAFIAWEDYRNGDGDIYATRVTGAGARAGGWPADGAAVCDAADEQYAASLTSDGAGGAIATWYDARGSAAASFARAEPAPAAMIAFALEGIRPSPASGALNVWFALPDARPARLEVLDVAGRRIAARDVGTLGPGRHVVEFGEARRIPAGIYLLRLTRDGRSLSSTACVLR